MVPEPGQRQSTPHHGPPRRRNGRPQACEPCRKRKVACDHGMPVCQRCTKRSQSTECVYLVQTHTRAAPSSPATHTSPSSYIRSIDPEPTGVSTQETFTPHSEQNPGYLGATSFSAVFEEAQNGLLTSHEQPQELDTTAYRLSGSRLTLPVDLSTLDAWVQILRGIPDQATSISLFKRHVNPNDGWCRLAAERLLMSLWTTFGTHLRGDRLQLVPMAQRICDNSSQTLVEDQHDPAEWLDAFSGPNLRWEALGILFTYWAFGSLADTSTDGSLLNKADRRKVVLTYKHHAWRCAEMSRGSYNGNTLLAYLLYKHSLLESVISGDASIEYWRLHGEAVALTTYLGLHVTSLASVSTISVASEVKRRLFAVLFNIDKVMATFTGRPPLLTRRYCSTPLPLDISDEVLLSNAPEHLDKSRHVDEHGWNRDGKIHSTTILRARTILAFIRDAILELAIGDIHKVRHDTLNDLQTQELDAVANFPSILIYHPTDVKAPNIDAPTLYTKLLVRLEHLQNLFFLERLSSKLLTLGVSEEPHRPSPPSSLVEISFEMVSLTLVFWTHQDRLDGLHGDFEWLVISYAAPAGGILCMALLQTLEPKTSASLLPSRSNIIQSLSLLIGFLDWVADYPRQSASPPPPNADLCRIVKNAITHVLDHSLNHSASISSQSRSVQSGSGFGSGFNASIDEPRPLQAQIQGQIQLQPEFQHAQERANEHHRSEAEIDLAPVEWDEMFNFDLLDTFDWCRGLGGVQ